MKVFVTGASGFLGSHFVKSALAAGHHIIGQRRISPPESRSSGDSLLGIESKNLNWVVGSLAEARLEWFRDCDALVHFASAGVSPQPITWQKALAQNLNDSLHMMQLANEAGINKFLICGTCLEYGKAGIHFQKIPPDAQLEPVGPYATSKAAFSISSLGFARSNDIKLALIRPFHFYGVGQYEMNFWPMLRKAALSGEDFPMTFGEQVRDYMPVVDIAETFTKSLDMPLVMGKPVIANIGSGKSQTLRSFAEFWWERFQAKGKLLVGAVPYRKGEIMRYVPDIKSITV